MQEEKEITSQLQGPDDTAHVSDIKGQESNEEFDWGRLFRRKDRPLPKRGCSVAFFIFLALLTAWLIFSYLKFRAIP